MTRLDHHQRQDRDDHPGIQRHCVEQEAELAEAEAGLLLVDPVGHQARLGALGGGIGEEQRRRAGDLRQAQLVDGALEGLQGRRRGARLTFPLAASVAAASAAWPSAPMAIAPLNAGSAAARLATSRPPRYSASQRVGDQRQVLPLPLRRAWLAAALTVQLDEGRALGRSRPTGRCRFAARQQDLFAGQLVGTHPAAEAEGATGAHRQRWAGRQQQRLAQQLRGATDDALHRTAGGGLRIVGVGGGVPRRSARRTVEVIDQGVVRVEHRLPLPLSGALALP